MIVALKNACDCRDQRYLRCASNGLQTVVDAHVPSSPGGARRVPHLNSARSCTIMNLLTDILAGLVHFVGWLV
ncbi:hypothetical protein E6R61_23715 [Streptomyces sp. LRa12]|nr:hypothetical protein E6R61_23715 [Streptomyces sp. LRa12]